MNHPQIQEDLFAAFDGQLSPERRAEVNAHVQNCAECRDELKRWKQTSAAFVQPLKSEASELFVQRVMRTVRAVDEKEEAVRWPLFARWAFPALALSVTGFAAAFFLAIQPGPDSTAGLLIGEPQDISAVWAPAPPNEDQILSSLGVNQ